MTEIEDTTAAWPLPSGPEVVRTYGGHATGAIAKVHPFLRQISVYRDHVDGPRDEDTPEKRWGRATEPMLLKWGELELLGEGAKLTPGEKSRSEKFPLMHAHEDARFNGTTLFEAGLVSAKNVGGYRAREWGSSKTDRVPDYCCVQETTYCGLRGVAVSYVIASVGGAPPELWAVPFHAGMFADLMAMNEDFHKKHVLPRIPPDPDGSRKYSEWVRDCFKQKRPELLKVASEDALMHVVETYRAAKKVSAEAETQLEVADQRLRMAIGEDAGLELIDSKEKIYFRENAKGVRMLRAYFKGGE